MRKIDVWPLLSPEMQAVVRKSEALVDIDPDPQTSVHPLPLMRQAYNDSGRYWNAAPQPVARVEDFQADCGLGLLPVRLYHPAPGEPRPWLLYLHGGGYVLGNLDTHDAVMRQLCLASGWAVLGVGYSLAPEARFPRQIEEIAGLVERLEESGRGRDRDPSLYTLAGDSAGAHLSLGSCLELRARGQPLPDVQLLFYGTFGLADSRSQRLYGSALDGLPKNQLDFYRNAYCHASLRGDPRYDVLSADLAGLPPSYLLTLTLDPLDDDSRALAQAFSLAGVPIVLRREENLLHGYLKNLRELKAAREVLNDAGAMLAALRDGRLAAWMDEQAQKTGTAST